MNKWIKRSIKIANEQGYLDKLYEVYPVAPGGERYIPPLMEEELKTAYEKKDKFNLVEILLDLKKFPKFPIDDPYVAFLRKKRGIFLKLNPQTVERISERLLSMEFEDILNGAKEPKKVSRQSGKLFKNWLYQLGYPLLYENEFESHNGIAFLRGTNGQLMDYANRVLKCDLVKRPDLVAKSVSNYIVGEAKFITDFGGGQKAQFEQAMSLLKSNKGNVIRIAILDGVCWIISDTEMFNILSKLKEIALSALSLKDFLEYLYRNK